MGLNISGKQTPYYVDSLLSPDEGRNNAHQYNRNTPYIPNKVLAQIEAHLHELPEEDQLVFQIFMETGMRAKEVAFLKESCLE